MRSGMAMTETSEVSLSMAMHSLPTGGTMVRSACGSTTKSMVCTLLKPSEREASVWPLGTAMMPALNTSPM